MPVHNGAPFLREAVDSILGQTYSDFELIIVDDVSRDETDAILSSYKDPRIVRVNNQEKTGLVASLNLGLRLARGQYIARMDADDVSLPERFEKQVKYLDTHPDIGILGTTVVFVDTKGSFMADCAFPCEPAAVGWDMLFYCSLWHPTIMGRPEVFRKLGGYSPAFRQAEDYEFWLRAVRSTRIANLPDVLLHFRRHGQNASIINAVECGEYALTAVQTAVSWLLSEQVPLPHLKMLREYSSIPGPSEAVATSRLLFRLYRGYCAALKLSPSERRIIRTMAGERVWNLHSFCRQRRWPAVPVHAICLRLQPARTLRSGMALLLRQARQLGKRPVPPNS